MQYYLVEDVAKNTSVMRWICFGPSRDDTYLKDGDHYSLHCVPVLLIVIEQYLENCIEYNFI